MHAYIFTYIPVRSYRSCIHTRPYIYVCVQAHMQIFTNIHAYTHVNTTRSHIYTTEKHACSNMHTYSHINTHSALQPDASSSKTPFVWRYRDIIIDVVSAKKNKVTAYMPWKTQKSENSRFDVQSRIRMFNCFMYACSWVICTFIVMYAICIYLHILTCTCVYIYVCVCMYVCV